MGGIVKDDLGTVRSGWVLATFAAVTGIAYFIFQATLAVLRLDPRPPFRLDDWHLFLVTGALFVASVAGTLVSWLAFRAAPGLSPPVGASLLKGGLASAAAVAVACLAGALAPGASVGLGHEHLGQALLAGLLQLVTVGPTSVGEEILLRGVAFQQLRRGAGTPVAILVTGGLFGLLHLGNPNVGALAAANVALVGLWFGLMVWRTGSLWTSIAMHVAWNFCEGFVFGTPVSGIEPVTSVWKVTQGAAGFWSGGAFGPEAAGVTTVVLGLACVLTLLWPGNRELPGPLIG